MFICSTPFALAAARRDLVTEFPYRWQSLLVATAGICLPLLDGGDVLVVEEHLEPLLRVVVTQLLERGPCWPKVNIFYEKNQGCGMWIRIDLMRIRIWIQHFF